jgi:hypothetical protein
MLLLRTCAGGGVAPESLAAANIVPVDCHRRYDLLHQNLNCKIQFSKCVYKVE